MTRGVVASFVFDKMEGKCKMGLAMVVQILYDMVRF